MLQQFVRQIVEQVTGAGGQVLAVGGSVRDLIIDPLAKPKDVDLMVRSLTIDQLIAALPGRVELVGQSFGVLKVTQDGVTVDVALPRTERSMGPGHRDFDVHADPHLPIGDDLARRDFTMNAVAVDLTNGVTYDPYGGMDDIASKTIRAVGDPLERFREDPLRMLRAVRFVSRLGFHLEHNTAAAMAISYDTISRVAVERIQVEMDGILMGRHPADAITLMATTRLLYPILPEFMESWGFNQHNQHHDKDVAAHVLYALDYAAVRGANLRTRWAVLLHDIAKPRTFTLDEQGHGHFYGHEDVGAPLAGEIMASFRQPSRLTAEVATMVREHLNPPHDATDKVLRRFAARMGELTDDALMCRECDLYAHAPPWPKVAQAVIDDYRERIAALPPVQGFTQAQVAVHGGEIQEVLGLQGPGIGAIKEAAARAIIDGNLENEHDEVLEWMRRYLSLTQG